MPGRVDGDDEFHKEYPHLCLDELCEAIYSIYGCTKDWYMYFEDEKHVMIVLEHYHSLDAQGNDVNFCGVISVDGVEWNYDMVTGNTSGTYFDELYKD